MMPPCGYVSKFLFYTRYCWRPADHIYYDKKTMTNVTACSKRRHYQAYLTEVAKIKEAQPL